MNERIRELSDIAYKNHLARNPHSSYGRRSDYDREFAELIVQECLKLNRDILCEDDPDYLDKIYKEHFGVEE